MYKPLRNHRLLLSSIDVVVRSGVEQVFLEFFDVIKFGIVNWLVAVVSKFRISAKNKCKNLRDLGKSRVV